MHERAEVSGLPQVLLQSQRRQKACMAEHAAQNDHTKNMKFANTKWANFQKVRE